MESLFDVIDSVNVNSIHATTDVLLSMINSYAKHAVMLEYCDNPSEISDIVMESESTTKKENILTKILRMLKELIRKFVKNVRLFLRNTLVAKKLSKAAEKYRRWKYNIPAIPAGQCHMKQTGKFHGENIAIEIDFKKNVIYSFVLLKEGHTPVPTQSSKAVHSIENFIDVMNRLLDRWLWMVEDKDKAFDRIKKHYYHDDLTKNEPIPGMPDKSGSWNGKKPADMEAYYFTNGYYDIWHANGAVRATLYKDFPGRREYRTPIDIDEFSKRYNEITKEYDAVVKRADAFCDKLEALIQLSVAKDDVDYNVGVGSDYGYRGLLNYDVYQRIHLAKNRKLTDEELDIISDLKDMSAQFAYPMSALVDGYMILRTEANALAEGLEKFMKDHPDDSEK